MFNFCWRRDRLPTPVFQGFSCVSVGKESDCNAGNLGLIPGLGRSPGEGKGYPFQYSGLKNSMFMGSQRVGLNDFHFHWHSSPWIYPMSDSLAFLGLGGYFLSNVREVFNYNLFKYFLIQFLFFFFFRDPYYLNVVVLNVVPEVFETVLITFYSFFFILLCFSYFHHSVFQLTCLFFCLSYSAICSPSEFLILFIVLFIDDYLFLILVCPC